MKIPIDYAFKKDIFDEYRRVSFKLSTEYGVLIKVCGSYQDNILDMKHLIEIYYRIEPNHHFSGTRELRKALRNKAFL